MDKLKTRKLFFEIFPNFVIFARVEKQSIVKKKRSLFCVIIRWNYENEKFIFFWSIIEKKKIKKIWVTNVLMCDWPTVVIMGSRKWRIKKWNERSLGMWLTSDVSRQLNTHWSTSFYIHSWIINKIQRELFVHHLITTTRCSRLQTESNILTRNFGRFMDTYPRTVSSIIKSIETHFHFLKSIIYFPWPEFRSFRFSSAFCPEGLSSLGFILLYGRIVEY